MLRQLARLTRHVHGAAGAVAIAVYTDEQGAPIAATDRGHEGVACVDDAARALALLCDVQDATHLPYVRSWTTALLEFLLYMQMPDGRFVNFITDWGGARNETGPTSFAGGSFWHARAVHALARARRTIGDPRLASALASGMAHVRVAVAPANVRAIHILTAIELLRSEDGSDLRGDLETWCGELVACRRDGILFDDPDQHEPHLWGHVQEGVLAEAGALLGRADLIEVARESALRYLAPLIDGGFDVPHMQPYGAASAHFGVARLASITGDRRFAQLAERARAWFHERNSSGRAVYDRAAGLVHDGIDAGILNRASGAESNIVAAQALLPELTVAAAIHRETLERLLPPRATSPALAV